MDMRSIVPLGWGGVSTRRAANEDPFVRLRREMDQLFDDFFGRTRSRWPGEGIDVPLDVRETDGAVVVTAELPGLGEQDIDVTLQEGVLTIRGEKKIDKQHREENMYLAERSYGTFVRSIALPVAVDEDRVEASFRNGLLTVTMPKTAEAQKPVKKVPVKAAA